MNVKRYAYIALILLVILSVSVVSAADNQANDIISADDKDEIILDEAIDEDVSNINNYDDEILTTENDLEPISEDTSTYSELSNEIGSGGNIELQHKYYTYDSGSTIQITTPGVINGNGAVIDMAGSTIQAFNITASDVTIKNLTIQNANYDDSGGAICFTSSASSCTVENCNFTNNTAGHGGALYFQKTGEVTNCNFTDNNAKHYGGAVSFGRWGSYGNVTNCTFTNNTAHFGGALYFQETGVLTNCNFVKNSADRGGGIFSNGWYTSADTCIFKTDSDKNNVNVVNFPPTLNVDNFTTVFNSGEKITFDLKTNISSLPVTDGNISISIYCKNNDSLVGNYICLSGEEWAVELPVGSYYAIYNTEYIGFEAINRTITITLPDIQYYANVTSVTSNNKTINITAKSNIPDNLFMDAKLLFILPNSDEVTANYSADGTWWAVYTFDDYGDHEVKASYTGYDGVIINNATISIRSDVPINVEDIVIDFGAAANVVVSVPDTINGQKISISVNETSKDVTVENGEAKVEFDALNVGEYLITVEYLGDDRNAANSTTAKLTVNKADSTLAVDNVALDYGESINLTAIAEGATGIAAKIDGKDATVDGYVITIPSLEVGEHTLTVTTIADANHNPVTKTATITVNKLKTKLTASAVTTTYNVAKNLVITLKDSQGKALSGVQLTVNLNGAKKYTTDKKGQVKINVAKLVPKSYTAKISFAGDKNYKAASTTAKVTVKKINTKIAAKAKTFKYEDKTKKYTITLKDNKNKVLKNKKVTLKVNGKTYTAKTNSKGVATFKLNKLTKKGKFNAAITYAGDKYYNKANKKAKLTVKAPAWKTVAKGSKDKATVKKIQQALKDNGYYLTYKGHYLKIDGIYKGCTERSVKEFQKDKKLKVTGKVDYNTAKKLKLVS